MEAYILKKICVADYGAYIRGAWGLIFVIIRNFVDLFTLNGQISQKRFFTRKKILTMLVFSALFIFQEKLFMDHRSIHSNSLFHSRSLSVHGIIAHAGQTEEERLQHTDS